MTNPNTQAAGPQPAAVDQMGFFRRHRAAIGLTGALVLGGGALGIAALEGNGDTDPAGAQSTVPSAEQANEACDNTNWAPLEVNGTQVGAASDAAKFNLAAFLPKAESVDTQEETQEYIANLFNGPLAKNGDKGSLAAIMATIGAPAHDGAGVNPDFNYEATFDGIFAAYNGEGGDAKAEADCKIANDTLRQVTSYVPAYVKAGDTITVFDPIRDTNNAIIGMTQGHVVSTEEFNVILAKLPATREGIDEFNEIGIVMNEAGEWSGSLVAKGITIGNEAANLDPNGTPQVSLDPNGNPVETRMLPDGNVEIRTKNKDTGEIEVEVKPATGPAGGNVGQPDGRGPGGSGDECGTPGQPGCEGPAGGQTPTNPGPGPTGPSGPGGPGTSAPGTTAAPTTTRPAPTTTRPAPTTTRPAPTTTRPAPTTTVWKPDPNCDPNIDVC